MVKNLLLVVKLLLCVFYFSNISNARNNHLYQGRFSVYVQDSCFNDSLRSLISLYQQGALTSDSLIVKTTHNTVTTVDTYSFNYGSYLQNWFRPSLGVTKFQFYVWNSNLNSITDSVTYNMTHRSLTCKSISVTPFRDVDSNCNVNAGDNYLYSDISIYKNNSLQRIISNNLNVSYSAKLYFDLLDYDSLDVIEIVPSQNTTTCAPGASLEFILDTLQNASMDFYYPLSCVNPEDFSVKFYGYYRTIAAPSYVYLKYANHSCSTKSTTLQYVMPTNFELISSSNSNYTQSGNVLTFNINNMPAGTSAGIDLMLLNTDTFMIVNDSVYHSLYIGNTLVDVTPHNNYDSGYVNIRGSYDPNQKTAQPNHYLSNDLEEITYLIEFENLGNDTAFRVRIVDTLSTLLDYSTFKILGSSHEYSYKLIENLGNQILEFDFRAINLVDSSNKLANKGSITYSIKPKAGLRINDEIKNTAHIYFDNNPAIVTNTTLNELYPTSITPKAWNNTIRLYPNPVSDILRIEDKLMSIDHIFISNVIGQSVYSEQVTHHNGLIDINTSSWNRGVYLVTCKNQLGETKIFKIVKQ